MAYKSISKDLFKIIQTNAVIPFEELLKLINGEGAIVIIRNFLDSNTCDLISENFEKLQTSRDKNDNVPGNHIGAYHFNKSLDAYFSDVELSKQSIQSLFEKTFNPIRDLQRYLAGQFRAVNYDFRVAEFAKKRAGYVVARKWVDVGSFSLKPHDDIAQLKSVIQSGFEIQRVGHHFIVGSNLCIQNTNNGGELILWNCVTDDAEREKLGISESGYPYPIEYLEDFEKIEVPIEKGDLYFVNSSLIHAVNKQIKGDRITLSFLMGKTDENTIVFWT